MARAQAALACDERVTVPEGASTGQGGRAPPHRLPVPFLQSDIPNPQPAASERPHSLVQAVTTHWEQASGGPQHLLGRSLQEQEGDRETHVSFWSDWPRINGLTAQLRLGEEGYTSAVPMPPVSQNWCLLGLCLLSGCCPGARFVPPCAPISSYFPSVKLAPWLPCSCAE